MSKYSFTALLISIFLFFIFALPSLAHADPADVSWPNCNVSFISDGKYGIIGATGGLDFTPNTCLSSETTLFSSYSLYMNSGYPGHNYGRKYQHYPLNCNAKDEGCLAYNYGYNAGKYAIRYAYSQGGVGYFWWIDVETENSWTSKPKINRDAILGMVASIQHYAPLAKWGVYSYPGQWKTITGGWKLKSPEWVATASGNRNIAKNTCSSPRSAISCPPLTGPTFIRSALRCPKKM